MEGEAKIKQLVYSGSTAVPELPPKVVRIFVSSTFVDAEAERNVLLNEVHNTVWWWCKHHDLDFQLVDMRWGVRDEASLDHTTSQICLREIQKCQNVSMGPNFLFLLGQRYGYRPLPATIAASMFTLLHAHVQSKDDIALLSSWYLRDDNAVPAVFVLQPITEEGRKDWQGVSERLVQILRDAAAAAEKAERITANEKHQFFMSVTEQEIREALESSNPDDHCIGVTRTITDLEQNLSQANAKKFCDLSAKNEMITHAKTLLQDLKENYTPQHLSGKNIHHFDVKWSSKGVDPSRTDHRAYLDQFSSVVTSSTIELIKRAQATFTHYALSKDELFLEVSRHGEFCRSKCVNFQGCEDIIGTVIDKVVDASFRRPIVIHGPSGSGKTSIMAMIQYSAPKRLGAQCVIVSRYLGTSSQSSTILNVILSVTRQICAAFDLTDLSASIPRRPKDIFPYFHDLLEQVSANSDRQLLLLFDSLDQLESAHGAHRCLWLPRSLPPRVSVVVSTLPDMHGILVQLRGLLAPSDQECLVAVEPLSEGTGDGILQSWMRSIGRGVTELQKDILKRAFLQCPQPLYLKLLFEEARRWHSYTPVSEADLAVTVRAAIWSLFERLERQFGFKLVSHALGYITAARSGLSHSELEDILSLDDEVLDEIYQYWSPVDTGTVRIPSLLWTRLKYELEEYLVERQADGRTVMVLYHRQFKEAAQARYLNDPKTARERYRVLADFFGARWFDKPKTLVLTQRNQTLQAYRKVASQPLRFDKEFNQRKISELPFSLLFAEDVNGLVESTFGNFEFLRICTEANSTQYVIEELSWILDHANILGSDIHTQLSLLLDTLRLAKPTLEFKNNTQPLAVEMLGRLSHCEHHFPAVIGRLVAGCRAWCLEDCHGSLLVPRMSCFPTPGGPLRTTLIGHMGNILHLSISDDGKYLATADDNGAVFIWEVGSDELMHSLKDPEGKPINHVTISHDNQWVVGLLQESGAIQVWSMQSGDPACRMASAPEGANLVEREELPHAFITLPRHSETVVCGVYAELMMCDIRTGECRQTCSLPIGHIKGLCLSRDDRYLHALTSTGHFYTLDLPTFDLVGDLLPHEGAVTCFTSQESGRVVMGFADGTLCLIQPDENQNCKWVVHLTEKLPPPKGDNIATDVQCVCIKEDLNMVIASADTNIFVWDYEKKTLERTLAGHEECVNCVEVTADNSLLVSGGADDIIIVWDLTNGSKVQTLEGQQMDICLLILHKSFIASASFNSPYIKLWDISPKYLLRQQHKFVDKKGVAAVTSDLRYVVHQGSVTEDTLCIWETSSGISCAVKLGDTYSPITHFAVTNSARFAVVGCRDGRVVSVNLATKKVTNILAGENSAVVAIAVRPDDRSAAVAYSDNTVGIVALQSLKTQRHYSLDLKGTVSHVCLTQQDALVMASDAGQVYVKLTPGSDLVKLEGNQSRVQCMAVSLDEQHMACGMDGANALVWDLQMTRVDLHIKIKSVCHICFTKDNQFLATASDDRKIRLWRRTNGNILRDLYIYSSLTSLAAIDGALIGTTLIGQAIAITIKDRKVVLQRQQSRTCAIL